MNYLPEWRKRQLVKRRQNIGEWSFVYINPFDVINHTDATIEEARRFGNYAYVVKEHDGNFFVEYTVNGGVLGSKVAGFWIDKEKVDISFSVTFNIFLSFVNMVYKKLTGWKK